MGTGRWTWDADAPEATSSPEPPPEPRVGSRRWAWDGEPPPSPSVARPVMPSPPSPATADGAAGDGAAGDGAAWIARPQAPSGRPEPAPPRVPPAGRPQVLLAEPDYTTARVLEHRLSRDGIDVTTVEDADAAMRHLAVGGLDLLLLDADLPGGAFDVLRQVRTGHHRPDLPVIVIGWPGNDLIAVRAFGLGTDDVITRPFSLVEAVARVRYQLARAGHRAP